MIVSYLFFAFIILCVLCGTIILLGIMLFRKKRIAGIITMIPGITLAICMLCFTGEFISDIIKEVKPEIWPMTDDDRFYEAVTDSSTEKMADMLARGHNPNKMSRNDGYNPWPYHNPLWIVIQEKDTDTAYAKAELLIKYGADLKTRPFVAHVLFSSVIQSEKFPNLHSSRAYSGIEEKKLIPWLKLLLDNGADIDARVYGCDIALWDWNYRRQAKRNGYTALNIAIRENAFVVADFLITHGAVFDEKTDECVEAATKLSGSNAMEQYISGLLHK